MNPHLRVVAPGLCTTVQDLGRYGYQNMAVPVSGMRDPVSLRLGNALVGNPEGMEGLEISLQGPTLEVQAESVRVTLCGTAGELEILKPEQRVVSSWQSVRLSRGTIFRVAHFEDSFGCCLVVEGGFDLPALLGSKSTFLLGGVGGFMGRALKKGDELPLLVDSVADRNESRLGEPANFESDDLIRVTLGPQDDYFEPESIRTFLETPYRISESSDRMGIRLEGEALKHSKGFNIASDGIATGAIQVPGNGLPIILFNDHQVTGGYAKIANVISADLPKLGRMRPHATLRFQSVSVEDAEDIRRNQESHIKILVEKISEIPANDEAIKVRLVTTDFIHGVIQIDD